MRRLLAALVAVALLGASGCSSQTPGPVLSDAAARQLQADVLAVTKSTAAHNWTVARADLATLTKDLTAARSSGTVSPARAATIQVAIAAVGSDIAVAAAQSSAPPKTTPAPKSSHPSPSPTKKKKHGGGDGGGGD